MIRTFRISGSLTKSVRSFSSSLSHIDNENRPCMVDITEKRATLRIAHAQAVVELPLYVFDHILSKKNANENEVGKEIYSAKGPVFSTAIIAGVMGAKNTANILPFCHPLPIDYIDIKINYNEELRVIMIDCIVKTIHKTGVEMEALTGATHAALCVYDMLKAVSKDMIIKDIKLISKKGGKSDHI
jgi:cyclic pyranopterin phosphate synthase